MCHDLTEKPHVCDFSRDFFMYTALKEGSDMMGPNGIQGVPVPWTLDEKVVLR